MKSPSAHLPANSQLWKQDSNFSTLDVSRSPSGMPIRHLGMGMDNSSMDQGSAARFLPDINTSRRLLKLSITEKSSDVEQNPFIVQTKTSEGTLIAGECERKVDRLEALKYKLI